MKKTYRHINTRYMKIEINIRLVDFLCHVSNTEAVLWNKGSMSQMLSQKVGRYIWVVSDQNFVSLL